VLSCQQEMEAGLPAGVAQEPAEEWVVVVEAAAEWEEPGQVPGPAGTACVPVVELRPHIKWARRARALGAPNAVSP